MLRADTSGAWAKGMQLTLGASKEATSINIFQLIKNTLHEVKSSKICIIVECKMRHTKTYITEHEH